MTLWIFVLAVVVAVVKTGDANHLNEAEKDERNIRNAENYRELAYEMRALRDTVRCRTFE